MSDTAKHTPGPWKFGSIIRDGNEETGVIAGTRCVQASCDGVREDVAYVHPSSDAGDRPTCRERDANAHLIAAAPEMLEALIWAQNALVGGWQACNVPETDPSFKVQRESQMCIESAQEKIRGAIAKAEGRA